MRILRETNLQNTDFRQHGATSIIASEDENEKASAKERASIFKDIMSATVTLEFALGIQRGIFNNFVVETLGIEPTQLGYVQGIREIPGLLTAPLAAVSAFFQENVYAGLCIVIAALGLFLHAITFNIPLLILGTLVLSVGFHLFYPIQSSMAMKASLPHERATRIGQLTSAASAASLLAFFLVILIAEVMPRTNYAFLHSFAGLFSLLGGVLIMRAKFSGTSKEKKSLDYNPKYMSYYVLTFLGGARRHVNMTFAGFLLVETYHTPVGTMVLLSAISSIVAIVTRPAIGRLIDKWGEQKSLSLNYALVVILFVTYAFIKSPLLLYLVFVLDTGLVGFDVAITTHLGKIAPKEVLSSAYAMGSTINHISGIAVPVIGGYLWDLAGAPFVFLSGAAIACVSLFYSMGLDKKEKAALAA